MKTETETDLEWLVSRWNHYLDGYLIGDLFEREVVSIGGQPIAKVKEWREIERKAKKDKATCDTCEGKREIQTTEWPAMYARCPDCA